MPHRRALGAALLALSIGLGGAGAADEPARGGPAGGLRPPVLDPGYAMSSHRLVLIRDGELSPRLVTLEEGQLVAWISTSESPRVVVFERDVARSMICHSLVNFSIQDEALRSEPLKTGEFASFCQLQPGRYRYKVVPPDALDSPGLRGEIVVGNP